jgi:hypothetical protein
MKFIRLAIWTLLLLASAMQLEAQNYTTVTASGIVDISGASLASGRMCWQATDQYDRNIGFIAGGSAQTTEVPVCFPITSGTAAGVTVANPASTTPTNILYRVTIENAFKSAVRVCRKVQFTGGTFNFNSYNCNSGVVIPPGGGTVSGNVNVSGWLSLEQFVDLKDISQPLAPASGYKRYYNKTGTGLCQLTNASVETCFGTGGGGGFNPTITSPLQGEFIAYNGSSWVNASIFTRPNPGTGVYGWSFESTSTGTSSVANLRVRARKTGAGTSTDTSALESFARVEAGTSTTAQGLYARVEVDGASSVATTGRALWADDCSETSGGTVGTCVGLEVGNITTGTTNFGIRAGTAPSTFGGSVTATGGFVGALTGNASTATALAGNGTNCSANQFNKGVDASGNAESCAALVDADIPDTITISALANYQLLSEKNSASGYAGLTASTKLNAAHGQEVWAVSDLSDYASKSGTGTAAIGSTITTPATNDLLKWSGTNWVNGTIPFSEVTGSVTDAQVPDTITASNYQLLTGKDAASGYAGLTSGTKLNLAHGQEVWASTDLSDFATKSGTGTAIIGTTLASLATNDLLNWNGTNWVNTTAAAKALALNANGGNCAGNNFALGVDAAGVAECAQPAFSNLSGTVSDTQLANDSVDGGLNGEIQDGTVDANDLGADSVSASELNATGVESELEAVLDLPDLQGTLAKAQQHASTAYIDAANTYSGGGLQDFGAMLLEVPNGTTLTGTDCDAAGEAGRIFVDTDATSGQRVYVCEGVGGWVLQGDGGGAGGGDNVTVDGATATDANLKDGTSSGTEARVRFDLDTGATPDDITAFVEAATSSNAGVVSNTTQTFAGAKTFQGLIESTRVPSAVDEFNIRSGTAKASLSADLQGFYSNAANVFAARNLSNYSTTGRFLLEQDTQTANVAVSGHVAFTHAAGTKTIAIGAEGDARVTGAGNVGDLIGVAGHAHHKGAGTSDRLSALYGFGCERTAGTVTNCFGAFLESQTAGTSNWGFYSNLGRNRFHDNLDLRAATAAAIDGSANVSSPAFRLIGRYGTGVADADDEWKIENTLLGGTSPASVFNITHAGSAGALAVQWPASTLFQWASDNVGSIGQTSSNRPATVYAGTSVTAPTVNASTALQTGGTQRIDSSGVMTNTSLDAEGTGNTLTIPVYLDFDVASCSAATASLNMDDSPLLTEPAAACIAGTNQTYGVADFDAATDEGFQRSIHLPPDWTGNIDVHFDWQSASTTNSVVWAAATKCFADAEAQDSAFNTASTVTDAAKGSANQLNNASISNVTATGCAADEVLSLHIFRDADNGSDNMTGDARLRKVRVTLRRAM